MNKERMAVKQRLQWYTAFIEHTSQFGTVDRTILERKRGVVEMLRRGSADDDPEGAAYAYMQLQKRDQELGGSLEKDIERRNRDMALDGTTPEVQVEFNAWLNEFLESLGSIEDE